MDELTLLRPGWLALAPVLLGLVWLRWRAGEGAPQWSRVCDLALLDALRATRAHPVGPPWYLLALAVLVPVALAEPARLAPGALEARTAYARVIALDLSLSMLAEDLAPSRLDQARTLVAGVLEDAREGRTGLVAFAGIAAPITPLTTDARTLAAVLPMMDPTVLAYQGSRPDLALGAAAELLERGGAAGADVILVTDGGHGARAIDAARRLRLAGHRLTVLAVGTAAGGRVVLPGGGELTGLTGAPVRAPVDGEGLRALAAAGGGEFGWLGGDADPLAALAALERTSREARVAPGAHAGWVHLGPWIALVALAPALAALRGPALLGVLALALAPGEPASAAQWQDLWSRPDQRAARALAHGRGAELEPAEAWRWRGAALHREMRFDDAADAFAWGDDATAHYNRGTALARAGRLREALAALDRALLLEPGHADARHNRSRVAAALARSPPPARGEPSRARAGGRPPNGDEPASRTARRRAAETAMPDGTAVAERGRAGGPWEAWFHGAGDSYGPDGATGPRAAHESGGERALDELEAVLLELRDDPAELWRIKLARGRHGHRAEIPARSDAW